MRDHKFRHSDLTARRSQRRLPKILLRVVGLAAVAVAVYLALQWLWPASGQQHQESDSNVIPLTLPPQSTSDDSKSSPAD
jgi:uncharacterized RDD family membrane protein YckC